MYQTLVIILTYRPHLEELNLARNKIHNVCGIETLCDLKSLDLDNNSLDGLEFPKPHYSLRRLSLSNNALRQLDCTSFPKLRWLACDNNPLVAMPGLVNLQHLDYLSLRGSDNQRWKPNLLDIPDARSVHLQGEDIYHVVACFKLTQLPGTSLIIPQQLQPRYTTQILMLRDCQLQQLPTNFGESYSNLRKLDISDNKIRDIQGLNRLPLLQDLDLHSNEIADGDIVSLVRTLMTLPCLKRLDLRYAISFTNFQY